MAPLLSAQLGPQMSLPGHSFTSDSLLRFSASCEPGAVSAQQLSVWGSGTVHRGQGPASVPGPALDNRPHEGRRDKMQPERIWTWDCILLLTSEQMSLVQPQDAQCLKQED